MYAGGLTHLSKGDKYFHGMLSWYFTFNDDKTPHRIVIDVL